MIPSLLLRNLYRVPRHSPTCCVLTRRWKSKGKKGPTNFIVEPTTMTIQKLDPSKYSVEDIPPLVTGYSEKGFSIQGNKVMGPVVLLRKGYYSWRPTCAKDITVESMQLFPLLEPRLELVIIGTGEKIDFVSPLVRDYLRGHGIGLEVISTRHATAMFNLLLDEHRVVAAALIPPRYNHGILT